MLFQQNPQSNCQGTAPQSVVNGSVFPVKRLHYMVNTVDRSIREYWLAYYCYKLEL